MLKKLYLLDMKQTIKIMLGLLGFQILAFIFSAISMIALPIDYFSSSTISPAIMILFFISVFVLVSSWLAIGIIFYAITVYHGFRFYNGLYSTQGYLFHTLPCTPLQLFLSKLFTFLSWTIVDGVIVLGGIISNILIAFYFIPTEPITLIDLMNHFSEFLETVIYLYEQADISILIVLLFYIIIFITGIFQSIAFMYFSVSIGQFFNRHRLIASIGIYAGTIMAYQIIVQIVSFATSFILIANENLMLNASLSQSITLIPTTTISVGITLACFISSYYIMKNKLNLE